MSPLDLAQLRFDEGGHAPPDGLEYIDNHRNQLVNSWQGFGRTVEAMAEKDFILATMDYNVAGSDLMFVCPGTSRDSIIDWDGSKPASLIEATHLAALEAVKNELKQQS